MIKIKKLWTSLLAAGCISSLVFGSAFTAMAATDVWVGFEGNGGTFDVSDGVSVKNGSGIREKMESGKTIVQNGYRISTPEFWDANREFEGWQLCTLVEKTSDDGSKYNYFEPINGIDLFTSSNAAMNYEIPDHDIYFNAKWEGNDEDYYTKVYLMGQGAELLFDSGLTTPVLGHQFRESIESLGVQIYKNWGDLTADPVRNDNSNATFEGWAIFNVDRQNDGRETFTLAGPTLYTTAEIMDDSIPANSIAYVAKWSDMRLEDYFNNNSGNQGGSQGPNRYEVGFRAGDWDCQVPFAYNQMAGMAGEFNTRGAVGESADDLGLVVEDPIRAGYDFMGWQVCEFSFDPAANQPSFAPVIGYNLLSTEDALAFEISNYDIRFVAQWQVSTDPYSVINFIGNDGEFEFEIGDVSINGNWQSLPIDEGKSLTDYGYTLNDPIYWDPSRPFLGWERHENGEPVTGESLYTTSEAMQYLADGKDVEFYAQWGGDHFDYHSEVFLIGYGAEFKFKETFHQNGQQISRDVYGETWGGDYFKETNETIGDQTKDFFTFLADPSRPDAAFEGWAAFKKIDDQTFELLSTTLIPSGTDIVNKNIASYNVVYVAKWSDIDFDEYDLSQYFGNNNGNGGQGGNLQPSDVMIAFDANDGSFKHVAGGQQMESFYHGKKFPVGTSVKDSGDTMKDPVFWDPNRDFLGWKLFVPGTVLDNNGNEIAQFVPASGVGLFTTDDAMEYTLPNHDILFIAQWDGEHYDYYSRVDVIGYGYKFNVYEYVSDNTNTIRRELRCDDWFGDEYKENGTTFRQQACTPSANQESYLEFFEDPSRPDARFEGWAEFKVDWTYTADDTIGEYHLVSNKLYTTGEMLDRAVPDYDVAYVAKWSDIPLGSYFQDESGDSGELDDSDSIPNPDDTDDEPQYSGSQTSTSNSSSASTGAVSGTVTTDAKKGQVNSETGIVTGTGSGYSSWIPETNASGDQEWRFKYSDGTMAAGTVKTNEDGTAYEQPAWEMINGAWYAFGADGKAEAGWLYDTELSGWFYIDINQGMLTGWQFVDGKWYYMQPTSDGKKGIMYANTWVDGWYVDASGAWDGQPQSVN